MFLWLTDNIGTIVISGILIVVVALVIASLIRDKKKGQSSCGCNCAHCVCCDSCHKH